MTDTIELLGRPMTKRTFTLEIERVEINMKILHAHYYYFDKAVHNRVDKTISF